MQRKSINISLMIDTSIVVCSYWMVCLFLTIISQFMLLFLFFTSVGAVFNGCVLHISFFFFVSKNFKLKSNFDSTEFSFLAYKKNFFWFVLLSYPAPIFDQSNKMWFYFRPIVILHIHKIAALVPKYTTTTHSLCLSMRFVSYQFLCRCLYV